MFVSALLGEAFVLALLREAFMSTSLGEVFILALLHEAFLSALLGEAFISASLQDEGFVLALQGVRIDVVGRDACLGVALGVVG